jgi:hypothetical protein
MTLQRISANFDNSMDHLVNFGSGLRAHQIEETFVWVESMGMMMRCHRAEVGVGGDKIILFGSNFLHRKCRMPRSLLPGWFLRRPR